LHLETETQWALVEPLFSLAVSIEEFSRYVFYPTPSVDDFTAGRVLEEVGELVT
jgi:hypothetical protein